MSSSVLVSLGNELLHPNEDCDVHVEGRGRRGQCGSLHACHEGLGCRCLIPWRSIKHQLVKQVFFLLFMVMVILSASVERFSVSRMRDFFRKRLKNTASMTNTNIARIAKSCPTITTTVTNSTIRICVLSFATIRFFEFCHNLSFWVLSQWEFSNFVTFCFYMVGVYLKYKRL